MDQATKLEMEQIKAAQKRRFSRRYSRTEPRGSIASREELPIPAYFQNIAGNFCRARGILLSGEDEQDLARLLWMVTPHYLKTYTEWQKCQQQQGDTEE